MIEKARFSGLRQVACALALAASGGAALAQPASVPTTPVAAPAVSPLTQIPGVTVTYYDVAGATPEAINASIIERGPRNAAGQFTSATATWTIGASLQKATTGTECKVVGATPSFKAEVTMPRLVGIEALPAPVAQHWQSFYTSLEQQQAEQLRYPYSRIGEVERAILASSCEGAGAAGTQAIEDIRTAVKARAAAAEAARAAAAAAAAPASNK